MKTIGLLGGMSWESTQVYYRELNQQINQLLGGLHSAQMVLVNVDFAPIEQLMLAGQWDELAQILTQNCLKIQSGGADFLVIATNTMHKFADQIEAITDIPLLHIADSVGQELSEQNLTKVGLLGTAFTMEEDFYKKRLKDQFGIHTIVPQAHERKLLNQIIFTELCQGVFNEHSKQAYLDVINNLAVAGAETIVLGCTEIGLLVDQTETEIPLIDATHSHIKATVQRAVQ